ncbi:Hypothetical protein I596_683 [Dokdonella koreensis DS-123]|uniref:Uncharacterized protein n=1 Tax=Dokdonella koreensis DS-123 TaxID=1300342 RepID=A0A167GM43_9GAMM|nr:Hypothetical protein I596_683 [Dokdonella koreensis DS-123]
MPGQPGQVDRRRQHQPERQRSTEQRTAAHGRQQRDRQQAAQQPDHQDAAANGISHGRENRRDGPRRHGAGGADRRTGRRGPGGPGRQRKWGEQHGETLREDTPTGASSLAPARLSA